MPESASQFFSQIHAAYDDLIRRCVPRYDEMLERLLAHMPESPARILELGCGTGNFTVRLVEQFSGATITTVDASPEMAAIAKERADARVAPIVGRFEDLNFDAGSFDLIVSSISLHHVRDKAPLYRRIARWLAPGGEFWFSDQLAGATARIHARHWSDWLAYCREGGRCSEEEIKDLVDHAAAHDHYAPLPEHIRLLTQAGFDPTTIDCVWRHNLWAIVGATRAYTGRHA